MPGPEDVQIEEAQTRPQLIAAYVPDVDSDSHKYGPNSTEFRQTISRADDMLHHHFVGIEQRNLSDIVNIVVVSHHGMATTSTERLVQLNDLIDLDLIEHIDGRPLYGLRPKDPNDLRQLYDNLKAESLITNPPCCRPSNQVILITELAENKNPAKPSIPQRSRERARIGLLCNLR